MRMYSKGWKSVYVPEVLTRGLVPASLPAFYRQQLKWSCGVFDLLFQEYPKLCPGFSLRQKIHFLLCPLFFLRGLIGFLEMLVPMACLVFGFIAWRATMPQIAFWFIPVLTLSALIHLRVQRWVLEPSERGLHFAGGLLAIATWWVYLAGFLCALFRIRVPYIPTPKEGDAINAGGIILPNLLAAAALTGAAGYGVYLDSSPYAIFMAGIAMASAGALIAVSIAAQRASLQQIHRRARKFATLFRPVRAIRLGIDAFHDLVLYLLRETTAIPALIVLVVMAAYLPVFPRPVNRAGEIHLALDDHRDPGGFYTGIELGTPNDGDLISRAVNLQKELNFKFRVLAIDQTWGSENQIPIETLKQLRRSGAMPFIKWLPTVAPADPVTDSIADSGTSSYTDHPPATPSILRAVRFGKYDAYLNHFAEQIRKFGEPVFISFAPQQDNPKMLWAQTPDGGNSPTDFAEAWKHITIIFREQGASNVAWGLESFQCRCDRIRVPAGVGICELDRSTSFEQQGLALILPAISAFSVEDQQMASAGHDRLHVIQLRRTGNTMAAVGDGRHRFFVPGDKGCALLINTGDASTFACCRVVRIQSDPCRTAGAARLSMDRRAQGSDAG